MKNDEVLTDVSTSPVPGDVVYGRKVKALVLEATYDTQGLKSVNYSVAGRYHDFNTRYNVTRSAAAWQTFLRGIVWKELNTDHVLRKSRG